MDQYINDWFIFTVTECKFTYMDLQRFLLVQESSECKCFKAQRIVKGAESSSEQTPKMSKAASQKHYQ